MPRMAISLSSPAAFMKLGVPLRAVVRAVLAQEKRRAGDIAIVLTGDDELRELNRSWRRIDRATDVISFAYDEHEPDAATRPVTGDLVVSMDRVAEQAGRFRVTPGTELVRLVVHGTLHLCGHDHAKAGERKLMRAREEELLLGAKTLAKRVDAAWPMGKRLGQ
jgi:probable rRNA maturation factor